MMLRIALYCKSKWGETDDSAKKADKVYRIMKPVSCFDGLA